MNSTQVVSGLDRLITVMATWFLGIAVQKHWITESDSAAFLPAIVALPAVIWGVYKNRSSAIVAQASALPEVQALTVSDPKMATAAMVADPSTKVNLS